MNKSRIRNRKKIQSVEVEVAASKVNEEEDVVNKSLNTLTIISNLNQAWQVFTINEMHLLTN